jgi:glycosyltransferase involved in cell wall biosynthesis
MKLAFLLPARAGGGGVHSVVQEAAELSSLGVDVWILVPEKHSLSYRTEYATSLTRRLAIVPYAKEAEIAPAIAEADVAIATIFTSVRILAEALEALERAGGGSSHRPRPAYYIQDYEPLFVEPGTPSWNEARDSYCRIPGALLFAKTRWLCDMVSHHHGLRVEKVEPSLDHDVFYPDLSFSPGERLVVTAMIRPATPRRAPRRTARILNWLAAEHAQRVAVHSFGCPRTELPEHGIELHPKIAHHGHLRREQVAELLRRSTYFLDLSDYQAFGRTGLEAMACGCIPIMPEIGGASEFIRDGINGFLVDVRDEQSIRRTLVGALQLPAGERAALLRAALCASNGYSTRRAALSEIQVLMPRPRVVDPLAKEPARSST